jgi:hypothetical protein
MEEKGIKIAKTIGELESSNERRKAYEKPSIQSEELFEVHVLACKKLTFFACPGGPFLT